VTFACWHYHTYTSKNVGSGGQANSVTDHALDIKAGRRTV